MAETTTRSISGRKPYNGPTYTYQHPQLGALTGRLIKSSHFPGTSTVQFRSIPYAQVLKRFAPCVPLEGIPDKFDARPHRDFTQFGSACPQLGATKPTWFEAYGGRLEDDLGLDFDEFTCLTISVSVPESYLSANNPKLLPVMIYVHGGGAQEGVGHVDGLHNNAPLAAYSSEISLPIVTVNIGYRLNWLGSLVCQDMIEEYKVDPSPSPYGPFNLTIQDQRAAFAWIRTFIGGFGGDAEKMTAFGESAGSIFLIYHICGSPERLFNRAVLQSGAIFGHTSLEDKDKEYQGLLKHFEIKGASASERLEKLRQVPAEALAQYPGYHIMPFVDDIPGVSVPKPLFSRGRPTFMKQTSLISSCPWLEDVVIGDDFWEGHVFRDLLRSTSAVRFVSGVLSIFPDKDAARLLCAYDLPTSPELASVADKNLFWRNLTQLIGDMFFSVPIHRLVTHLARQNIATSNSGAPKRKVYRYCFGLSNPFPGSDHSFVPGHHFVEILFVFLTLLDRYPTHRNKWLERQARETARKWVLFANGEAPWDEYMVAESGDTNNAKVAVCDDIRGWHVKTMSQDEEESKSDPWGPRRYVGWGAWEKAYQALKKPGMSTQAWAQSIHMARLRVVGSLIVPEGMAESGSEVEKAGAGQESEKELREAQEKVSSEV
ncbi:uncharacterized protein Z520_12069 [Fonsecaea multimorphosa CBS 102226]|uniref:Carboxylesterase type B domain-containing protein n=1 Tax=Fonsecaea multimorphosa CBS 102226 TaxID=1442371 RepID=A0A0D2K770_9EURO|nr:uncharacterized protein Z520_12069 [Fonsecaea multimorphosa CBS 102226]KIX92188.1 hypothetical protein Z520_12069 [Fonsecaea multimorphosa CBS 102226]OAL17564.1 hypothetical protein AYO22_11482 [Fonsecaea multimorphosa]